MSPNKSCIKKSDKRLPGASVEFSVQIGNSVEQVRYNGIDNIKTIARDIAIKNSTYYEFSARFKERNRT